MGTCAAICTKIDYTVLKNQRKYLKNPNKNLRNYDNQVAQYRNMWVVYSWCPSLCSRTQLVVYIHVVLHKM